MALHAYTRTSPSPIDPGNFPAHSAGTQDFDLPLKQLSQLALFMRLPYEKATSNASSTHRGCMAFQRRRLDARRREILIFFSHDPLVFQARLHLLGALYKHSPRIRKKTSLRATRSFASPQGGQGLYPAKQGACMWRFGRTASGSGCGHAVPISQGIRRVGDGRRTRSVGRRRKVRFVSPGPWTCYETRSPGYG